MPLLPQTPKVLGWRATRTPPLNQGAVEGSPMSINAPETEMARDGRLQMYHSCSEPTWMLAPMTLTFTLVRMPVS